MNPIQWHWLALNILKDEEEDYKTKLNLVEYLASFWNSKAVRQIKRKREMEEKGLDKATLDKITRDLIEVIK